MQRLLKAAHDLDAPWRPRDVEQRQGRIERQGNENEEVEIYRYVTEGSFDAYMWQTLETKQRFIQQVMTGDSTVREAEDLERGALSFAEIKAIASGNPLVMEKVRIDTEVRRLDMLRAAHLNQHYEIGRQVRALPELIERSRDYYAGLVTDIATRDLHTTEAFTMTVNGREYSGKHGREEAGAAVIKTIMASVWEDSREVMHRGYYKGLALVSSLSSDGTPWLYLRGTQTYETNLNTENALGTIASIESTLRRLDRFAEEEQAECERNEKALADYREQLHRPFEHEERLRELCLKQQEMNRSLDLDKSERQVVYEAAQEEDTTTDSERPAARETVIYSRTKTA